MNKCELVFTTDSYLLYNNNLYLTTVALNYILNRVVFKLSVVKQNEILCDSSIYSGTNSDSVINNPNIVLVPSIS